TYCRLMLHIEALGVGPKREPFDYQRHTLAALLRHNIARCPAQIRPLEHDYRRFRRWSEAVVWETVLVTLAKIMADSGHYSITGRAHVSAAGGQGGLIGALLASRGVGSPVSYTVWQMPEDDRSPSTKPSAKRRNAMPMTR
ncbi:MAG: hypothetical protein C0474_05495, partial [Sphingobium sp.]|nr:hypothetical protein [Sphingobium sp.]